MRRSIWRLANLALFTASTVPLLAQGSQAPASAPPMLALTGCIAAAPTPANSGNAAPATPSTSVADRYVLTKAAVAPSPTEGQPAANQPKPPIATQYRLNGSDSMLAPFVAHQVKVTGKIEEPASKPASGGNMPTFKVDAVRMLEATCS